MSISINDCMINAATTLFELIDQKQKNMAIIIATNLSSFRGRRLDSDSFLKVPVLDCLGLEVAVPVPVVFMGVTKVLSFASDCGNVMAFSLLKVERIVAPISIGAFAGGAKS